MIKLGSVFSDGAVLQQGMPVPVWGETEANRAIIAELAGQKVYCRASGSGDFQLRFAPLSAGGPYELKVYPAEDDKADGVVIRDVLIGEVWLCSGQSNMAYVLGTGHTRKWDEADGVPVCIRQEQEFLRETGDPEKFRFIDIPHDVTGCREKYVSAEWEKMSGENALRVSAVAAWFGLKLRRALDVPVGLVCCSWGGSTVESWTSPAALKMNPDTRPMIEKWESMRGEKAFWLNEPLDSKRLPLDPGNTGVDKGWASPDFDDSAWRTMKVPGSWIAQKIAGNGAVWIRRKVDIPEELAGKDLVLKFGAVDKHDITYFNGVEIGRTGKGLETGFYNWPRRYVVPGNLVRAGENTVAVRGYSFSYDGAFGGPEEFYALLGGDKRIPLAGEWRAECEYDWGRIEIPKLEYGTANSNTPGIKFDTLIRPLLPYAVRGVIWYQGEQNAQTLADAEIYQREMETLIRDWRFHWEQPDMPFLQVQLADFRQPKDYDEDSFWPVLREGQRRSCFSLPGVYLATALGTGETSDIHPQNKKDVGMRLAAQALYHVYGKEVLPCGPAVWKVRREKDALRVFFHFADGLELRDAPGRGFYLAGADRRYFPADRAEIDGDSILLSSSQVSSPVALRYAWSDHPCTVLYNREYPAESFAIDAEEM